MKYVIFGAFMGFGLFFVLILLLAAQAAAR